MRKKEKIIDGYIEIQKENAENMNYSMQRLDLLVISISGAGIYAVMELSKFLVEQKFCSYTIYTFQIPVFAFILAIIFNLVSQHTGYKSNNYDFKHCAQKIKAYKQKEGSTDWIKILKLDARSTVFDYITRFLNLASLILLIAGMIATIFLYAKISIN